MSPPTGEGERPKGRPLRLDPDAESARTDAPAFLAKPEGAPVYHGFPLIESTRTEGWCYGAISEHRDPAGCEEGDGYVEAPDGSRAGLVWSVGEFPTQRICEPTKDRWGVYAIAFPRAIRTDDDLVACFRAVLPELQAIYERVPRRKRVGQRRRRWWWPLG